MLWTGATTIGGRGVAGGTYAGFGATRTGAGATWGATCGATCGATAIAEITKMFIVLLLSCFVQLLFELGFVGHQSRRARTLFAPEL